MAEMIEIKLRVLLNTNLPEDSVSLQDVVHAVLEGNLHPLVENIQLIQYRTE
jgi:hypothetical protein